MGVGPARQREHRQSPKSPQMGRPDYGKARPIKITPSRLQPAMAVLPIRFQTSSRDIIVDLTPSTPWSQRRAVEHALH
jgi:hypothetical protein